MAQMALTAPLGQDRYRSTLIGTDGIRWRTATEECRSGTTLGRYARSAPCQEFFGQPQPTCTARSMGMAAVVAADVVIAVVVAVIMVVGFPLRKRIR